LFCRMLFTSHAGLTWDELCLVIEEQPWPDGSTTGRGGSQVRVIVFEHCQSPNPFFQGPDLSLKKSVMMLHRASEKDAEKGEARGAKVANTGGKQALDPLSHMGALHQVFLSSRTAFIVVNSLTLSLSLSQLYDAGLLTAMCPSHVSHAADVNAPVMYFNSNPFHSVFNH
jgi:hypothetical protein